jgi:predicted lysophospholipase L1 biosynthesis ABC-type transport system permease subunit
MEIVGVVRDAKYSEVKAEVPPLFFRPWRQAERIGFLTFYVRTTGDPAAILRSVPLAVSRVDPHLPVEELKTLPQQVRENVSIDRMVGTLAAAFAALATLLASVGLYGMLAYTVARRTREIGVRMALGASQAAVRGMVLRQVSVMLLVGGVIGIAGALALGRVAASLLFGIDGRDPLVIVLATTLLALFAVAAAVLPAQRAAAVEPVTALRYD